MTRRPVIVAGVSDVSLGYGSPQIPAFLRSLREHFQADAAYVFEPDQSGRPPRHELFPDLNIIRVPTAVHPYNGDGWVEYNGRVGRRLRQLDPDVLVTFSPPVTPSLWMVRGRPKLSIYYMLESLGFYVAGGAYAEFLRKLHRYLRSYVDLVVFPEENRAALDASLGNLQGLPLAVMYNTAPVDAEAHAPIPPEYRLQRFLYTGSIQRKNTLADYFLDEAVRSMPIDLFGPISGEGAESLLMELSMLTGNICYHGLVDAAELNAIRRRYCYSLVLWAPLNDQQLYACPNKFFEAIADGVPPITGPHPQCKAIIERYQCGILMDDWSFPSFQQALKRAWSCLGTPQYQRMVDNCRVAAAAELNWETQFDKVRRLLPARAA